MNVRYLITFSSKIVKKDITDQESKLYEDHIALLREEVDYLKKVLDKVLAE